MNLSWTTTPLFQWVGEYLLNQLQSEVEDGYGGAQPQYNQIEGVFSQFYL